MILTVKLEGIGNLLYGQHADCFMTEIRRRMMPIRVTQERQQIPIMSREGSTFMPGERSIEFEGSLLPGDAREFLVRLGMALYDGELLNELQHKEAALDRVIKQRDELEARLEKYEPKPEFEEEDDPHDY